jgi:hypothetical protein
MAENRSWPVLRMTGGPVGVLEAESAAKGPTAAPTPIAGAGS